MNAGTIIAQNYLAQARVLAASYLEHHPDTTFFVLIVDSPPQPAIQTTEAFEVLRLADIGLDEREAHRMAAIYDLTELATAVKPWFLRHLLERSNGDPVAYFDPDVEIFTPLPELAPLAEQHSIVLTPHITEPSSFDPDDLGEYAARMGGVYNLGFIAVGRGSSDFLDWWSQRLSRECIVAPDRGLHTDQRWIDFVPGLFDHTVLRDAAFNLAWWNVPRVELRWTGARYEVDGRPLRFFHFTGFDPQRPHLFSEHQGGRPAVLLSEHADLRRLCHEYAAKALAAGHSKTSRTPYGWGALTGGMPLDRRTRRLYRSALLAAERDGAPEPPNPFDDGRASAFVDWLNEPVEGGSSAKISRYLHALWQSRDDLRARFPDVRWADAQPFLDWVAKSARAEEPIPHELVPHDSGDPDGAREPEPLREGVSLVGYLRAETGVGEAARQLLGALDRTGIPFATVTYAASPARQEHDAAERAEPPTYDTNVICVNADQIEEFAYEAGSEFFAQRYSIGLWWWEIAEFPSRFDSAFDVVHEVWVGSEHSRRSVAAATSKPVLTIPVPVEVEPPPQRSRAELGLPEGFVFLFSFDFLSIFERKNPIGVVDAFKRAFRPGEGPTLVIKNINGERALAELERLRAAADERSDIRLVEGHFSAQEKNALMGACDCYVSLHRSEGFGLTMAEAMAYGKPVIATAYSGNLTFMDEANSYLVPYELGRVPSGCDPYPAGSEWAEPDLDEAARLMRHVHEHQEEAGARGELARQTIRDNHSTERTAAFLTERLNEIRKMRNEPQETNGRTRGLDRAFDFVTQGANGGIEAPSRLGPLGRLARRTLFRVLRPYTFQQRTFESAVLDALREAEESVSLTNDRLAQILEQVERLSRDFADARFTQEERVQRLEDALKLERE
ncbi:MAG: glycosyltransferase [Actinomycetota bacterium]|nr:glycosyltransferase [Actinomycetota bacterium]